MSPYKSTFRTLVESAEAAHTEDGVTEYSKQLAALLLPSSMSGGYVGRLSKRLASAEMQARNGQRNYIPESSIAEAFNYLMENVEKGANHPARTDRSGIHDLRKTLFDLSPFLSSVNTHAHDCLPSEAVLLVAMLISNNGTLGNSTIDHNAVLKPGDVSGQIVHGDSRSRINRYMISHSGRTRRRLYDNLFKKLGV